jgi:surface polysaccharide O-acyltransferase-like enzyme
VSRIQSIDTMRVVAIVAVIAIHTDAFTGPASPIGTSLDLATVVNQLARFAVPFFFIMAGYFWAQKVTGPRAAYQPTLAMARRALLIFVVWSLVYLLETRLAESFFNGPSGPLDQIYANIEKALSNPFNTALQGTKAHLWFLPALISSVIMSAVLIRLQCERLLMVLAVIFYIVALAGTPYSDTPLGFRIHFNFRNGPFISLLFFVTGYFMRRYTPDAHWLRSGLLLACAGMVLHFIELSVLNARWGTTMAQDFVLGTYPFGVGMAMIALSNPRYLNFARAAAIGPLVLGIYASHYIFVDLLRPLDTHFAGSGIWSLVYIAAVFVLSYLLVRILAMFNATKKIVT